MLIRRISLGLLIGACAFALGCSDIQGESLLTDKRIDSSSFTLDKSVKVEELYIRLTTSNFTITNLQRVDISGECYVSTYPFHSIVVLRNNSQVIPILDLNTANNTANTATCMNGRFNFSLPNSASIQAGSNPLRVVMRAYETLGGAAVTNDVQGASSLGIIK